jgi:hypothetical protein
LLARAPIAPALGEGRDHPVLADFESCLVLDRGCWGFFWCGLESVESAMKSVILLLVGVVTGAVSFWAAIDRQKFCKGDLISTSNPTIEVTKTVVRTESYTGNSR